MPAGASWIGSSIWTPEAVGELPDSLAGATTGRLSSVARRTDAMPLEPVTFTPIGVIRTPFAEPAGMPIQAAGAAGTSGSIELDPAYAEGLADLEGLSHLILLYHLHRVGAVRLTVVPYMDTVPHGLFATRSPARPNSIGLSTVRLVGIEGTTLRIEDVDML